MTEEYAGLWVVVEINQASGTWTDVDGPLWSREDAEDAAYEERSRTAALGRRDRFRVGYVAFPDDEDVTE